MTIGFAHAELIAVLVAVTGDEPRVMTIRSGNALPSGPFEMGHRTLQSGLREWVQEQTEHPVGYLEQLYTFADRDRNNDIPGGRTISISYLGLVNEQSGAGRPGWHGWYEYFPWEDHRKGRPAVLDEIMTRLSHWADADFSGAATDIAGRISPSASTAAAGTRIWRCSATNCFMKRGSLPKPDAQAKPISAGRCLPITAGFWRPGSQDCAPRSNTVRWSSN